MPCNLWMDGWMNGRTNTLFPKYEHIVSDSFSKICWVNAPSVYPPSEFPYTAWIYRLKHSTSEIYPLQQPHYQKGEKKKNKVLGSLHGQCSITTGPGNQIQSPASPPQTHNYLFCSSALQRFERKEEKRAASPPQERLESRQFLPQCLHSSRQIGLDKLMDHQT